MTNRALVTSCTRNSTATADEVMSSYCARRRSCVMVPAYHASLHALFTMHQVNRSDEVDHTSESTSDRALTNGKDTDKSSEPATHSEPSACYDNTMLLTIPQRKERSVLANTFSPKVQ